ncbi:MAG: TolC family protein [Deltaproteobacteria bacterium]
MLSLQSFLGTRLARASAPPGCPFSPVALRPWEPWRSDRWLHRPLTPRHRRRSPRRRPASSEPPCSTGQPSCAPCSSEIPASKRHGSPGGRRSHRLRQAGTLQDPMLDLGLAPLSIGSGEAPFGFEATVSQKLPWFGKRPLEKAASAAEAHALANDYQAVQRELALRAVLLYQQYFIATRSLEINAAHVELMRLLRDAVAVQLSSGRGSAESALQAEAELAHLEHDAVVLAAQRDVTVAQMNELLHRAPELALPPPPQELPPLPERQATAASLQQLATQGRPDILAIDQRAQAQQTRVERAERESYPDLTLSTSYSSMWDMPAHRWMLGLGFNLPIQTGARAGAADEARSMRAQLEQEAARMRHAARTRVFVTLQQLEESKHVLSLFETRLLPIAQRRLASPQRARASARCRTHLVRH